MLLDVYTQLSNAQAVTDADAVSDKSYDTGDVSPVRRVGAGEPLVLAVVVTTAASKSGGSFTDAFEVQAIQSAAEALSAPDVIASRPVAAAELVPGQTIVVDIPPDRPTKRFLGARYLAGTGDTVSYSAWIIPRSHLSSFFAYAKGYEV